MPTETLNQFIKNHSLARQMREYKADIVWDKFSHWLKAKPLSGSWHNALYRFALEAPFCYLNPQAVNSALEVLNIDLQATLNVLNDQGDFISRAIFSFLRPTTSLQIQSGERVSIDTPSGIEDFENIWHPEYIKYCEQVYNHLIKIPLDILGKRDNKNYLSLALSLQAEKLRELGFPNLVNGFDSIVRNAISHGGIEYDIIDVHYIDKREKKKIYAPDVVNLLDDLFDTCNSIIVATIIFVIENQAAIEKSGVENLPLGIKFLLADGFASHNGSKLMSFVESGQEKLQLNINLKTNTTARGVHQLESLQAAWAICYFGGKKYDRFLVNVDCKKPVHPLAVINGAILRDAIQNDMTLNEVAPNLFESSLLWYDASKFQFRLYALLSSFKTSWKIQKRKFRLEMLQKGIFIPLLHYKVAFFKNTSPKFFRRLEGHIVLDVSKEITETDLIKIIKSSINRLRRRLIKRTDIHGEFGLIGYPFNICLRIYATDKRIRKLISYSWQNEELVAIAEFSKNWEKAPPFYTKEPNRILKHIRIKYNQELIKTVVS